MGKVATRGAQPSGLGGQLPGGGLGGNYPTRGAQPSGLGGQLPGGGGWVATTRLEMRSQGGAAP